MLYFRQVTNEKARKGFEAAVTIADGETLYAVHDDTAFGSCVEGFAITDRRLVLFDKKGAQDVPWASVSAVVYAGGFPYTMTIKHAGGERSYGMALSGIGLWASEALREAAKGDFTAAARSFDDAAAARGEKVAAESARLQAQPFALFHGLETADDGTDMSYALGVLFIGAAILVAFRFGSGMNSGFAVIFTVSFWVGLVAYPIIVVSSFRSAMKPGARKTVYAVNELRIGRKVLRGTDDPLWNAKEAPADLDLLGLRDREWKRGPALRISRDAGEIVITETTKNAVSGKMDLTERVKPAEFKDPAEFEAFVRAIDP
jgi:hypothetical protein